MNDTQVKQLIQGIGLMTELWTITYQGFKNQGLSDDVAMAHTRAFMSIMLTPLFNNASNQEGKES